MQCLSVADVETTDFRIIFQEETQNAEWASKQPPAQKHDALIEGGMRIHSFKKAESTFPADFCGFDRRSVRENCQDGKNCAVWEKGVINRMIRPAQDASGPNVNTSKMLVKQRPAARSQHAKQPVTALWRKPERVIITHTVSYDVRAVVINNPALPGGSGGSGRDDQRDRGEFANQSLVRFEVEDAPTDGRTVRRAPRRSAATSSAFCGARWPTGCANVSVRGLHASGPGGGTGRTGIKTTPRWE